LGDNDKTVEEPCGVIKTKKPSSYYFISSLPMYIFLSKSRLVLFILFVTPAADSVKKKKEKKKENVRNKSPENRIFLSWCGRVTPQNENNKAELKKPGFRFDVILVYINHGRLSHLIRVSLL